MTSYGLYTTAEAVLKLESNSVARRVVQTLADSLTVPEIIFHFTIQTVVLILPIFPKLPIIFRDFKL
jgi:hypothetical protein